MLLFEEWRKLEYIVPEEKPRRVGREPTTNSTHIWRQRQDLCPGYIGESRVLSPLRHPCYRLLKTSDYRRLLTEVIVLHRDGLGDLLRCQSQSHFAKWQINIKLFLLIFFFSKNDCKKSWQNVSFSNCWAFATGWISSAKHFGNTMFLYIINQSPSYFLLFTRKEVTRRAFLSPPQILRA